MIPRQTRPETTTLVSSTSRTTPLCPDRIDLDLDFLGGHCFRFGCPNTFKPFKQGLGAELPSNELDQPIRMQKARAGGSLGQSVGEMDFN